MSKFVDTSKNILNKIVKYYRLAGCYFMKFIHNFYLEIIMILATAVCLYARYKVVLYPTNDMVGYILNGWLKAIQTNGFASFYKVDSDYSPLYLFMLAIVSLFPTGESINVNGYQFFKNDMIYMKSIYFAFTIALAIGIYLITRHLTKSKVKAFIGYIIVIALPTVFVNSAVWGNCDVIYATYIVFTFYFILKGKDGLAFTFFGLAFANKMQAVFILPFLVYLLVNRKMKLWKVVFAAIAFMATLLPCYFCGASFTEPFTYIQKQMNGYKKLTLGCPNMWQLMEFQGSIINDNATWIGLSLIGVVLGIVYFRHVDLSTNINKFKVGTLLIMSTIFFLPYMHERYFYLIDVLVVVYALIDRKKIHFIPLMQISSGIAYYHYISGYYFIQPWGENSVHIAAFINLFILGSIFYDVLKIEHKEGYEEELASINEEIKELKAK